MKNLISPLLFIVLSVNVYGQDTFNIESLREKFESYISIHQPLKTYSHINKDIYLAGETIYGKSYTYDAIYNLPDSTNNIVYISLRDTIGNELFLGITSIIQNQGQFSIPLNNELPTGYYQLATYTKWQLNKYSGSPHFKEIFVVNLNTPISDPNKTNTDNRKKINTESPYEIEIQNEISKRVIFGISKKNGKTDETINGIIHSNGIIEAHFPINLENNRSVISIQRQDLLDGVHEIILLKNEQIVSKEHFISKVHPKRPAVSLNINTDTLNPRGTLKLQLSYAELDGHSSNLSISINNPNWLYSSSNITNYNTPRANTPFYFSSSQALSNEPPIKVNKLYPKEIYGFSLSGRITPPTNSEATIFLSSPYKSTSTYYQKVKGTGFTFSNLQFPRVPLLMLSLDRPEKYNLILNKPLEGHSFSQPFTQKEPTINQLNTIKRLGLQNRLIADSYGLNKDLDEAPPALKTEFHFQPDISVDVTKFIYLNDLKEIVDEIIPAVRITEKEDKYELNLYVESKGSFQKDPQIFVDMIPINDINQIINLPSEKISKIEVIKELVVIDDLNMNGVLSIHTKQGNLGGISTYNTVKINDIGLSPKINHSKVFNSVKNRPLRTPYLPSNIYWNPSLVLKNNSTKELEVTLPDSAGNYVIIVEGITSTGKPIHIKRTFTILGPSQKP